MNEINLSYLNNVKHRFLPLPRNATEELEHEPNINDFTILKELGNGSYGKVYLACHKKTEAKFAIKAIDKLNIENKREKAYFNREVEIMYKLDHPNISKLYGHFEDEKYCYLIMEYIPNGSAFNLLPRNGSKPDLHLVASIIRDVIRAVYYLHNMMPTVIHRDIKPENILLDESNNAHLIDFGWSNYIINHRKRNTICGTPLYYPPEMVYDTPYDEKVDIWSIGILLIELSTGSVPFEGDDVETVKNNISKLNITWPYNIDNDVKDLCIKILKTNPNQRLSLENILEHKFFKKHLNDDKELIKPKKNLKNKIFVFSKDVPEKLEKNNSNENSDKKQIKSHRSSKDKNIICNHDNKSNTDSKIYLLKNINKHNIDDKEKEKNINNKCNSNYINKIKVEKKLMNRYINSDKNLIKYNNSFTNNFKDVHTFNDNSTKHICTKHVSHNHSNLNYRNKNNDNADLNKENHVKIYSVSFISNKKEENKINYPKYFIPHANSLSNNAVYKNRKNSLKITSDNNRFYISKNFNRYNTFNNRNNNSINTNIRKNDQYIKKEFKNKNIKVVEVKNNYHQYSNNIIKTVKIKGIDKINNSYNNDKPNNLYINDIFKKKENNAIKNKEDVRIKKDKDKERKHNAIINKYNNNYIWQIKVDNSKKNKYLRNFTKYF